MADKRRICVFGAGGYIGIPLCVELRRRGHVVIPYDRWYFGTRGLSDIQVGDTRLISENEIRYHRIDCVIDLAGLSNDASADIDPKMTISINHDGGLNLLRMARAADVQRYIYSSSASVYGDGESLFLTEESAINPITAYAKSKRVIEMAVQGFGSSLFETVILRNATVFGVAPRMRFDLAVNIMTLRAWRDGVIFVMGGGRQWRPFVHVADVVRAFVMAVEEPADKVSGEIFNVGGDDLNFQIETVANKVRDIIPGAKLHHIPDDPDKRSYHLSFAKIRERLGFEPVLDIVSGIQEIRTALNKTEIDGDDPTCYTLGWYRKLLEWDRRLTELKINGVLL